MTSVSCSYTFLPDNNVRAEKEKNVLPYPKAVGFIIANEFCERFSYYGMRTILSLYMRSQLGYTDDGATIIYHMFTMFCYFFPLLGAMIADGWLGKFKTITYLSMLYAAGSILMSAAAMPPLHLPAETFTMIALLLIAFGTGGIKPCVSAFGGDQFVLPQQQRYLSTFFSLFYFSINAGSLISTFITPILRADVKCFGENSCYSLAFGVPGVLMVISLIIFVLGKRLYIIKNPSGNIVAEVFRCIGYALGKSFRKSKGAEPRDHFMDNASDKYDPGLIEDIKALLRVLVLFIPLPVFWTLFDQQGSRWTFQASRMDQDIGSWTLQPDQLQVLNPLLVLAFIPFFEICLYPFFNKINFITKPLQKMTFGGVLAAIAFLISAIVEWILISSYGTPVSAGLSQLRVYNGYNCNFQLETLQSTVNISQLSAYENLNIKTVDFLDAPYNLTGLEGQCKDLSFTGHFMLLEQKANSFTISNGGVTGFIDNNEKAVDGVKIRFLVNSDQEVPIDVKNSRGRSILSIQSNDQGQREMDRGVFDVLVNNTVVMSNYDFARGAVYTVNVDGKDSGNYSADVVTITPPNSVHILWLVPQYVVMTIGEVMFSVTGLEFAFTQAPRSMKSVLTSIWLLTVALGNLLVILIVEGSFLDAQWKEFLLFAGLMMLDMLIFAIMARRYNYVAQKPSTENLAVEPIKSNGRTKEND